MTIGKIRPPITKKLMLLYFRNVMEVSREKKRYDFARQALVQQSHLLHHYDEKPNDKIPFLDIQFNECE